MATHSSILAWRIPWTEEPGGLQSTGLQRVKVLLEAIYSTIQNYVCHTNRFLALSSATMTTHVHTCAHTK